MLTAAGYQYGASGLPFTGIDVRWILAAGLVVFVLGVVARREAS